MRQNTEARGCFAQVLLAELWHFQVWGHSVPLLALAGVVGTVGCMNNAVIWEYAAAYRAVFTTWLSIGMGVSSCIPSLIALVQNPGPAEVRHSQPHSLWAIAYTTNPLHAPGIWALVFVRLF